MNKNTIKANTQIAIALLGNSLRDRYWNPKITHNQRNFITSTALEILETILLDIAESDALIVTETPPTINPPEES
ncbi:hypothetical protein [Chamaesiphon sp. OTE_20_metabat_361]|uniref:hypothetical protein n=1 Tax=Chamaesiphon sp. OTE_20_metabat_361 TaxID=2964689 RepID=UPI00286CCFB8|nr:hypothetical protein [Chamaesiphon sp. OTE_20_metabat_361]